MLFTVNIFVYRNVEDIAQNGDLCCRVVIEVYDGMNLIITFEIFLIIG